MASFVALVMLWSMIVCHRVRAVKSVHSYIVPVMNFSTLSGNPTYYTEVILTSYEDSTVSISETGGPVLRQVQLTPHNDWSAVVRFRLSDIPLKEALFRGFRVKSDTKLNVIVNQRSSLSSRPNVFKVYEESLFSSQYTVISYASAKYFVGIATGDEDTDIRIIQSWNNVLNTTLVNIPKLTIHHHSMVSGYNQPSTTFRFISDKPFALFNVLPSAIYQADNIVGTDYITASASVSRYTSINPDLVVVPEISITRFDVHFNPYYGDMNIKTSGCRCELQKTGLCTVSCDPPVSSYGQIRMRQDNPGGSVLIRTSSPCSTFRTYNHRVVRLVPVSTFSGMWKASLSSNFLFVKNVLLMTVNNANGVTVNQRNLSNWHAGSEAVEDFRTFKIVTDDPKLDLTIHNFGVQASVTLWGLERVDYHYYYHYFEELFYLCQNRTDFFMIKQDPKVTTQTVSDVSSTEAGKKGVSTATETTRGVTCSSSGSGSGSAQVSDGLSNTKSLFVALIVVVVLALTTIVGILVFFLSRRKSNTTIEKNVTRASSTTGWVNNGADDLSDGERQPRQAGETVVYENVNPQQNQYESLQMNHR